MICVEQLQHILIILEKVDEESSHFLLQVFANSGKCREVAFALLVQGCYIPDMQPLAAELCGESANLLIF